MAEDFVVRTRWTKGEGGRSDAVATGGPWKGKTALDLALDENKFSSPSTKKEIGVLKSYALFYSARSLGNKANAANPTDEDIKNIMVAVKKAVESGYANHREILLAEKELHHVFKLPEFEALIKELSEASDKRIRAEFPKKVAGGFALFAKAEKANWKPDLKASSGESFWTEGNAQRTRRSVQIKFNIISGKFSGPRRAHGEKQRRRRRPSREHASSARARVSLLL